MRVAEGEGWVGDLAQYVRTPTNECWSAFEASYDEAAGKAAPLQLRSIVDQCDGGWPAIYSLVLPGLIYHALAG